MAPTVSHAALDDREVDGGPPPAGGAGRARATGLRSIGRALRHRNYRLFFSGQSVSLIGTWLTRVATSWLIYRLTGSAVLLGVLGFAGQIPTFFLAPLAGVLVDRWDRYRVLLVTQILAMVQSALLAGLALAGVIDVWHVLALSVFQGLINAFDMPARQSMVVQMVEDRADLPNAIALNSSMVNLARLLGPAIAGVVIAAVGEGWCFFVDALSYVAVITSLLLMRIPPRPRVARSTRVRSEMAEGFRYVRDSAPIRSVLLLLAVVSLMGVPYMVLLPVIAREVLGGGPGTLGTLTAASGLGALGSALYLASRRSVHGLDRIIVASAALFGAGLCGFSRAPVLWLALPLLFLTGVGMMLQTAASMTLVQTLVDEDKRGRVMSLVAMAYFGALPFGSLLAGVFADRIGAQNTILLGGAVVCVAAAVFFRALPELRRVVAPSVPEPRRSS
jgi:MFS family permease